MSTTMCMMHFHFQTEDDDQHNRITNVGLHQAASSVNVRIESARLKGQPEVSNSTIITGRKKIFTVFVFLFFP